MAQQFLSVEGFFGLRVCGSISRVCEGWRFWFSSVCRVQGPLNPKPQALNPNPQPFGLLVLSSGCSCFAVGFELTHGFLLLLLLMMMMMETAAAKKQPRPPNPNPQDRSTSSSCLYAS